MKKPIFYGKEISFFELAKYLGVILDKKLIWKEHFEHQYRRFCTAFWACRTAIGLSRGLRLLYAVVVWWSRTQLITVKEKLDQLQAMILRGITGAMRTTPTAALGFMLAEVPLHIAAVKKAALTMSSSTAQGRWKFGGIHTKLPRSILSTPELSMVQDRMIKRVKFKPRFKVITPSRTDGKKGFPLGDKVWYTDGSKIDCGAGFGIYRKTCCIKVAESLGQYDTVWQAEFCAILTCSQMSIQNGTKGK